MAATITLNDVAIGQIAEALAPHIERILDERLNKRATVGGPRLLRQPQVTALTGVKRAQLYRLMHLGTFPNPVKIGQRAVAWREDDIRNWIDTQVGDC